jgi:hypothetical protein
MACFNPIGSDVKTALTIASESAIKETSAVSDDDVVSEVSLAASNAKWQVRGLFVALGGFLGWILVSSLGSAVLESNPFAVGLFRSTGVESLHSQCAVAWTMLTGLAGECHAPSCRRCIALHCIYLYCNLPFAIC